MAGNTLIEDIDYYNRTHHMFSLLQPTEKRINEMIEGYKKTDSGAFMANKNKEPDEKRKEAKNPL